MPRGECIQIETARMVPKLAKQVVRQNSVVSLLFGALQSINEKESITKGGRTDELEESSARNIEKTPMKRYKHSFLHCWGFV